MTFRHLFPVLAGFFLPFFSYGQLLEWTFYTKEDGLSANEVGNMTTLDNGLVWVISGNRSLRFDGRKFEEYPILENFISEQDRLYGLQPLDDSLLCFSTFEKLILVNPRSGAVEYLPYPSRQDPEKELFFIMPIGPGEWLFYFMHYLKVDYEIWRFKDRQFKPVKLPYARYRPTLISVLKFETDRSFVFAKGKLSVFDSAGIELETVDFSDGVDADLNFMLLRNGPGDWVTFMAKGRFYQLNLSDRTFRAHPANRFIGDHLAVSQNFVVDQAGNLWATGMDKTLLYYDVLQDTLYNFARQFDEEIPYRCLFKGIMIDETGVIWISTQLGLLKIVKQKASFDTYLTGTAADNRVYSTRGITETEGGALYVGTYNGTIWIDPVQKQERLVSVPHDLPFHLYYQDSILWLNNGNAWDLKKETFHTVKGHNPHAQDRGTLAPDHAGRLWWLSSNRLSYRRPGEYQSAWQLAKRLPVSSQTVCDALHVGAESQSIWIGCERSLFQYFPDTDNLLSFSKQDFGHPLSRIMALHENEERTLWLGTDLGLLHFDPLSRKSTLYQTSDGLPDNYVCGLLLEGDSCIWLSTNYGLSSFHIEQQNFSNFFEMDGLPSNEFNRASYFKARDGRMYFGGLRGLIAFYPEEVIRSYQDQAKSARLVLTAFEKTDMRFDTLHRDIQIRESTVFHFYHWDRSFTFEFALTDYSAPEQIKYSYLMEGYEKVWSKLSNLNFARYNNLPPGQYTFKVRARNRKGLWHEDQLAVAIVVHPPWWNTWWAKGAYLFVALAGFGAYFRWQIRAIESRNVKLERTVTERTLELQEQKRRAEQSEKYKEQFLANMSHEIRTPMNAISGMVRILLRNRHLPEQHKFLDAIRKSSANLLVILNDILDLSKIEAGKMEIQHIPMQLDEVLTTVVEILRFRAEDKGLRLLVDIDPELHLSVYGDPYRLTQILNNLVGNAIKFTDAGTVRIRAGIDQDELLFSVEDSGIGISKEKLDLIFQSFEQEESTSTRAFGGTGLGLSISRQLVHLLGGEIRVESTVGVGSTFSIHLPYEKVEAPIRESQKITAEELKQIGRKMAGLKLLLVDDNDFNLMLATDDLHYYIPEVSVCTAKDGEEAVRSYDRGNYDLILMDVQMPGVDGLRATEQIRERERRLDSPSKTPIIAMTASLLEKEIWQCFTAGMDDYVPKPYRLEEFIPVLYRNLKPTPTEE